MTILTYPAVPFPGEPLDVDPGPQQGDPGPTPPPANLEPMPAPTDDPVLNMIGIITNQAHDAIDARERYAAAFISHLSAGSFAVRSLKEAISRLRPDDMQPEHFMVKDLYREVSDLHAVLAPICEPKPSTH